MRLVALIGTVGCAMVLTGCDPSADFVFGSYDIGGQVIVLGASSGPSGENPRGTLEANDDLLGTVGCLSVVGNEARIGLDLSPSVGLSALARVTPTAIRLSPSGLPASQVCDADLEPGPPQTGSFIVRDLLPG